MKTVRLALLLWGASWAVQAAPAQDHQALVEVVTRFVQEQTHALSGKVSIQVEAPDSRLNLAACASPEAFIPPGGHLLGHGMVGVRCLKTAEGPGWSVYIPVQVTLKTTFLVARRALAAEKILSADDVVEQTGETSRTDLITNSAQVIGKVVKQGVGAGQPLRQDMVRDVYTIRQGQTVQVLVDGKGFKVSSEGQAMNNAGEGQSVQVRTASGRLITGVAGENGVVRVNP
jgi:flagella basal body P-ring formation protein FlgA